MCLSDLSVFHNRLKFDCDDDEETDTNFYYDNDPELPIFSTVTCGYPASELAHILLAKDINMKRVCHIQPPSVTTNATFVVDVDDVSFCDLQADDLGTWKANGTKSTYFFMSSKGVVHIASGKPLRRSNSVLTRRYYTHGTYKLFRRVVVDIRGRCSPFLSRGIVLC